MPIFSIWIARRANRRAGRRVALAPHSCALVDHLLDCQACHAQPSQLRSQSRALAEALLAIHAIAMCMSSSFGVLATSLRHGPAAHDLRARCPEAPRQHPGTIFRGPAMLFGHIQGPRYAGALGSHAASPRCRRRLDPAVVPGESRTTDRDIHTKLTGLFRR
jgi:hypothetical protein